MKTVRTLAPAAFALALACAHGAGPVDATRSKDSPKDGATAAPRASLEGALAARKKGDFDSAERELRALLSAPRSSQPEDPAARLALFELFLTTGRPELVLEPSPAPLGASVRLLRARARHRLGELDLAQTELAHLAPLSSTTLTQRLEAAVLSGAWHLERGQKELAAKQLSFALSQRTGPELAALGPSDAALCQTWIGRAAHLLGSVREANEAYNAAETSFGAAKSAPSVELLLFRAELFLDKHDTEHAGEVLAEAQALDPVHPDVLALLAAFELEATLDFGQARKHLGRALDVDPRHPRALALSAGIALRELDFVRAEELVRVGLGARPLDLEVLAVGAAVRLLSEDEAGFEARVQEALGKNPHYAELFGIVSDFAEWEHRYADMERLLRRGARLDPEDGRLRGQLGLVLTRSASENAGVVELRRAFELDPYDVRVINTLELYERIVPERYVEWDDGPFRFRVPKDERALLERYVPALVKQAAADMERRYAFSPRAPIAIELYASREQFAVRTSGLPRIGIAGVCFGRKLATVSPFGSPGNLGMTLWHELGHVYHIGLSKSRVPRWLTEGLAEWETARLQRGWSRELDRELWLGLDRLPPLSQMSRAFTHAERLEDVGLAYYAAGRLGGFLVERFGMARVQAWLGALGTRGLDARLFGEVLGEDPLVTDRAFREHERARLGRYEGQFFAQRGETEQRGAQLDPKQEPELLKRLEADFDPQLAYTLARLALGRRDAKAGLAWLAQLFERGHDGYDLRLLEGQLWLLESAADGTPGELEEVVKVLSRATELDPTQAEAWALLAAAAQAAGDSKREFEAVSTWADLSEHDGAVHRRRLEMLLERPAQVSHESLIDRALWADLASPATHRLAALLLGRLGKTARADFEWESSVIAALRPGERRQLLLEWAEAAQKRGQSEKARGLRQRAEALAAP